LRATVGVRVAIDASTHKLVVEGEPSGVAELNAASEFFIGVLDRGTLVAFGGVTPDPYGAQSDVGRLRHVYVQPHRRGEGIGQYLVALLEARARTSGYARLRLRTDAVASARFHEQLGYAAVSDDTATHQRTLSVETSPCQPDER
jgi:GNAT superfamily N-acetyltransferase